MDGDHIAAACDECKHAYPYRIAEFHASGMTDTPDPFRNGKLNLWHVFLECENRDCRFLTGVYAPKPSHVQIDDMRTELGDWTVHDVLCVCGLMAVSPRVTLVRLPELPPEGTSQD
jgi:hypothetical protein